MPLRQKYGMMQEPIGQLKFAGKSGDAAMSVTARIRQRSIFKKKLNRDDILQLTGLAYGVSDENFVLCRGEKADHTLIYDETKLARGLDLWLEDTDILLSLSLPTSPPPPVFSGSR